MTTRREFLRFLAPLAILPVVGPSMLLSERPTWLGWTGSELDWLYSFSMHDPDHKPLPGACVASLINFDKPNMEAFARHMRAKRPNATLKIHDRCLDAPNGWPKNGGKAGHWLAHQAAEWHQYIRPSDTAA